MSVENRPLNLALQRSAMCIRLGGLGLEKETDKIWITLQVLHKKLFRVKCLLKIKSLYSWYGAIDLTR